MADAATIEARKQKARDRAKAWYYANKERGIQRAVEWNRANKERRNANNRKLPIDKKMKWRRENPEKYKQTRAEHFQRNKKTITAQKNERQKQRRKTDPTYRIVQRCRQRLSFWLKQHSCRKTGRTFEVIGCTPDELQQYLQKQLPAGKDLKDYHVDHIFPLAMYDLTKDGQERRAMHWSNLQPLTPKRNTSKACGMPTKEMAAKVQRWAWPDGVSDSNLLR